MLNVMVKRRRYTCLVHESRRLNYGSVQEPRIASSDPRVDHSGRPVNWAYPGLGVSIVLLRECHLKDLCSGKGGSEVPRKDSQLSRMSLARECTADDV